jgi:hypothetical protein
MAFTQAPIQSVEESHDVKLFSNQNIRYPSFWNNGTNVARPDEDICNTLIDVIRKEQEVIQYLYARPACTGVAYHTQNTTGSNIRGMHYWADLDFLFYAIDHDLYLQDMNLGTITRFVNAFPTTTGYFRTVGFCEFQYTSTNTVVIVATDGTTLVTVDSTKTLVTCVDPDLPAPHQPFPVYIDGYVFLSKTNTGDIYNSDLDNPVSWTPGNFITVETEADNVLSIMKHKNYLVAFGSESIEFFYDAGISSGSPLQRYEAAFHGIAYNGTPASCGDSIYFLGHTKEGGGDIFEIKNMTITPIGDVKMKKLLGLGQSGLLPIRQGVIISPGNNKNYYYVRASNGIDEGYWFDLEHHIALRMVFGTIDTRDEYPLNLLHSTAVDSNGLGQYFALKDNFGYVYSFSIIEIVDSNPATSQPFYATMTTDSYDFGTMNKKTMSKIKVYADRPTAFFYTPLISTYPNIASVGLEYSDDDYQTFSPIRWASLDQDLPVFRRCGNFRQRIFRVTLYNNGVRISKLNCDVIKGYS